MTTLRELLEETGLECPASLAERTVNGVTCDSREAAEGYVFVAVRGYATDGHLFAAEALKKGAVIAITEEKLENVPHALINPAGNNRELLASLAAAFHRYPWNELKTVGITGTNGKTSTAHMLRWILEKNGIPTGIMGTVGHVTGGVSLPADVTTPDSTRVTELMRKMADSGDGACVMEVSSHALSLGRVSRVRYDAGVFTNISQDHLDFHGTMEEYLQAKLLMLGLLKENGKAVVGTYAPGWPAIPDALTFGEGPEDDWRITGISSGIGGSSFTLTHENGSTGFAIPAPGGFNVFNAAGAVAAARVLGIDPGSSSEALSSFAGVPGRMEGVHCGQEFLVAVDYAHTPDALERVLTQGRSIARGRLIAVFGCGGDRDSRKRPIMGRIAATVSDLAIVTSDNPRTEDPGRIIQDILQGIPEGCAHEVEPDRAGAIRRAIQIACPGDVVIIAGKGHEDYQILGREKIHFDDREHAREALAERGFRCGR